MKVKTSELTGAALDWAVAKTLNIGTPWRQYGQAAPAYSTDWAQGGPIIEREGICLIGPHEIDGEMWGAYQRFTMDRFHSPSPLIAAMRCYVASKLGDEVDVPEGLL